MLQVDRARPGERHRRVPGHPPGRPVRQTTRSARNTASVIEWVTSTAVAGWCSQTRCSSTFIVSRVMASSAPKGSSRSRTSGSAMSARAMAARWAMPTESSVGRWSPKPSISTRSSMASARSRRAPGPRPGAAGAAPRSRRPRAMATGGPPGTPRPAPPPPSGSTRSSSHTARSPIRTWPSDGGVRPATARSSVVLPQPDGPTTATTSPSWTVRSMPSRAWTADGPSPNCFSTPSRTIWGMKARRQPSASSHRSLV